MATTRVGQAARARARAASRRGSARGDYWAPDRHRTIPGDEAAELIPALAPARPHARPTCSTTARPTTSAWCSPSSARRSASARVSSTAPRSPSCSRTRAGPPASLCTDARVRRELRRRGRQRGQRDRGLGRSHPAGGDPRRGGGPADRAQPRHPRHRLAARRSTWARPPASSRPGQDRRSSRCPGTAGRLIGTTDRDYDGDIDHAEARRRRHRLPAAAQSTRSSASSSAAADITGAYAGVRPLISTGDPRKSVDISRKAELYETSSGLLTITGGKLTTWRRMAKQVVDRMVEREGREAPVPHRRHPAGDAGGRGGPGSRRTACRRPTCPTATASSSPSATGTPARNVLQLARERPRARGGRSSRAIPTCWPRR